MNLIYFKFGKASNTLTHTQRTITDQQDCRLRFRCTYESWHGVDVQAANVKLQFYRYCKAACVRKDTRFFQKKKTNQFGFENGK